MDVEVAVPDDWKRSRKDMGDIADAMPDAPTAVDDDAVPLQPGVVGVTHVVGDVLQDEADEAEVLSCGTTKEASRSSWAKMSVAMSRQVSGSDRKIPVVSAVATLGRVMMGCRLTPEAGVVGEHETGLGMRK